MSDYSWQAKQAPGGFGPADNWQELIWRIIMNETRFVDADPELQREWERKHAKPQVKIEETRPHCWRRPYEIYVSVNGMRGAMKYDAMPFAVVGTLEEVNAILRERENATGLPIFLMRGVNAKLPRNPPDGIFVRPTEFDELDPHEIRCVRRW